ncbi:MAG: STAS domain-containing protein [Bacteroidales bacterium]|jgi:anti-anti-sigma factor|nr:STAS domain-containing protein [Bacteroidales bacterium]MBQ2098767.1 STAS domain-containing protein [Bacteroidales bacterium]MBQ5512068.1 STAS domain-containing protein [Bacteroidales bacterium]MBR4324759.1 STAS domain-containing protein [Bacteroidales bacterium]
MENTFEVKKDGNVLEIVLGQELTTANAPALMDELNKYKNQGVEKVVFDATALKYIASSGIRTIIFAKQKLGGNPEIEFINCAKEIYSVFEMTGIQEYINFIEK